MIGQLRLLKTNFHIIFVTDQTSQGPSLHLLVQSQQ